MNKFKSTLLATALLAVTPLASAATATDPMTVSITIENSCTVAANDMSFGTVSTLATAIVSSSTVSWTCTSQGPIVVAFNAGTGTGASFATRKMTNGANTIDYTLYRDSARTEVLGDGTSPTVTIGGTPVVNSTGGTDSVTIYGRVFAGQNPKPVGTYNDTVTATITF